MTKNDPPATPPLPDLPPFAYRESRRRGIPDNSGRQGGRGLSILKPPYGRITAYDMNKGEIAWQIANGDTPAAVKSHPALQGLNIPKTGSPRQVGIMVTKTLVFAGDGTDPLLNAYDKKTGQLIAQLPDARHADRPADDLCASGPAIHSRVCRCSEWTRSAVGRVRNSGACRSGRRRRQRWPRWWRRRGSGTPGGAAPGAPGAAAPAGGRGGGRGARGQQQ